MSTIPHLNLSSPLKEEAKSSLWMWGRNNHGELSIGTNMVPKQYEPKLITMHNKNSPSNFAQVALGYQHTVALSTQHQVYVCGSGLLGRCGVKFTAADVTRFKILAQTADQKVVKVCCAEMHSVAILNDGSIKSWGGSLWKKLGHQTNDPIEVCSTLKGQIVSDADCGRCHTAVCTKDGAVYTFGGGGRDHNFGQLGHGDTKNTMTPTLVAGLSPTKIIKISCGAYHTLVLSDELELFSFGRGNFGQLGAGNDNNSSWPIQVGSHLPDFRISNIAAGENHSIVCTTTGKCFAFGFGQQGQLGLGSKENKFWPTQVEGLIKNRKIVQVAAGWRHSMALTDDEHVFSWGDNQHGQLGTKQSTSSMNPQMVTFLEGKEIKQIAAGGDHSLALDIPFTDAIKMHHILEPEEIFDSDEEISPRDLSKNRRESVNMGTDPIIFEKEKGVDQFTQSDSPPQRSVGEIGTDPLPTHTFEMGTDPIPQSNRDNLEISTQTPQTEMQEPAISEERTMETIDDIMIDDGQDIDFHENNNNPQLNDSLLEDDIVVMPNEDEVLDQHEEIEMQGQSFENGRMNGLNELGGNEGIEREIDENMLGSAVQTIFSDHVEACHRYISFEVSSKLQISDLINAYLEQLYQNDTKMLDSPTYVISPLPDSQDSMMGQNILLHTLSLISGVVPIERNDGKIGVESSDTLLFDDWARKFNETVRPSCEDVEFTEIVPAKYRNILQ